MKHDFGSNLTSVFNICLSSFTLPNHTLTRARLCDGGKKCGLLLRVLVCVCACEQICKTDVFSWREIEENKGCHTQLIITGKHPQYHQWQCTGSLAFSLSSLWGNFDWIYFLTLPCWLKWVYMNKLYKSTRLTLLYCMWKAPGDINLEKHSR